MTYLNRASSFNWLFENNPKYAFCGRWYTKYDHEINLDPNLDYELGYDVFVYASLPADKGIDRIVLVNKQVSKCGIYRHDL